MVHCQLGLGETDETASRYVLQRFERRDFSAVQDGAHSDVGMHHTTLAAGSGCGWQVLSSMGSLCLGLSDPIFLLIK